MNIPRSGNYLVDMYDDWLDSQSQDNNEPMERDDEYEHI